MKKRSSVLFFLLLLGICVMWCNSKAYAQNDTKEVKLDTDISVDVDSSLDDCMYISHGNFSPSITGFYDLTVSTDEGIQMEVTVNDITKQGKIVDDIDFQSDILDSNGKWENVCYLEQGKKYAFNFNVYDKLMDEKKTQAKVTYKLSLNTNQIKSLPIIEGNDRKDLNVLDNLKKDSTSSVTRQSKLVYSFKTTSKGMYSFILDTDKDKEYRAKIIKKSDFGKNDKRIDVYSYCDVINKTYNVNLDALADYYIIYEFTDDSLKNSDTLEASCLLINRKVKKVDVKMKSSVFTSFDDIIMKKFDVDVTYDDGTVDREKNIQFDYVPVFDQVTYEDDFYKFYGDLKPGQYTLKSKYFDVEYKCTFTVVSGYDYTMKNGKVISKENTLPCKNVDNAVGYYIFVPTKDGLYLNSKSLDEWSEEVQAVTYKMVDSNGNEIEYDYSVGYKLKANKKYAFYLFLENRKPQEKDFVFSITFNNHKHKVVIDKAVAATYTHTGKTKGTHCSLCDVVITKQKVIPKKQLPATKIKKVVGKTKGVSITWSKVKDATSYIIYRKKGKKGKYVRVTVCNKKTFSFLDKKVKISKVKKAYYYVVRAVRTQKVSGKKVSVISKVSNVKGIKR